MTPSSVVQQHPSSVDAYIRHGWSLVPIPSGTKGPRAPGWNQRDKALRAAGDLPPGYGIGLAHAYSGTMALDIDGWVRASFELMLQGINLQALYDAPDAVVIDSGRPGHGKLLYAMPPGVVLPSRKLTDTDAEGRAYNYLDFRCGTANGLTVQDVLPPSIHPDTGQPYRWAGRGHWTRLPQIPDALLTLWQRHLDHDSKAMIPTEGQRSVSWSEVLAALPYISPDCSRTDWVAVGMALHWAGHSTGEIPQALMIWDEWSRGSATKYPGEKKVIAQWRSFRVDKGSSVTLGTLFHMARKGGWRPAMDVSALFSGAAAPLMSPADLRRGIRPLPPEIDLGLFPAVLRDRAQQAGIEMGCDPLAPLWAGLATISGAMDARTRLELLPRYKVPGVLWMMVIGNPALKKSPASKPMYRCLDDIEREDRPRYAKDLLMWEAKEAQWAKAKKAFLDFAASPEAMLDAPMPDVPELPPKPVPVKITNGDTTSQALVRMVADRPRGMLCILDEMYSWIRKIRDPRNGEDRSAWVVSYEADKYEMDRVGAGSIRAETFAVTIYGNIQPRVYQKAIRDMADDGLLQRFLPVLLRERDWGIGTTLPDHEVNVGEWESAVRLAYAMPPQTYRLSDEAREVFRDFQRWYNRRKQDDFALGTDDVYMTAFGKLEGTVGRLTLVMHMIEAPFSPTVSADLMGRVVKLAKTFIVPTFRHAFATDNSEQARFDAWLIDWVLQRADESVIRMTDIRQAYARRWQGEHVWAQDRMIIAGMTMLAEAGWVTRTDDGSQEIRHIAEWAIDPRLHVAFAADRRRVVDAAQRAMLEIQASTRIYAAVGQAHGAADLAEQMRKAP